MNVTETLNKIKALFAEVPAPAPAPEAPAAPSPAYTLADGTPVEIDKLEVGGIVTIQGMPAPEGELVLSDGTKVTVDANGVITNVAAPEAPEAPAPSEDMAAFRAEFETVKTQLSGFAQSFGQLQTDFATAKETISKQDQAINLLLQAVEQLSQVPTEAPAQAPRSNFNKKDHEGISSRVNGIANAMRELNKK